MFEKKFIQYLNTEKRFSSNTVTSYLTDLRQFYEYLHSKHAVERVEDINFQFIRSWISSILESGLTARTVNRKISTLKTYFRFLLKLGLITENPIIKIIPPKSEKKLPVFISIKNMSNLFNKIDFKDTFEGKRDKLILEFFYATGVRLSEIINIKVHDINFEKSYVKVLGKRNKERLVPLTPKLSKEIKLFMFKYELKDKLFVNLKGKKMYHKEIYRLVVKYINLISTISKKSPHVLRHTFATHMLNNGADINAIKELLGHTSLATTQIYAQNSIEKLKQVYKQAHPRA
jgi:integrase/recombinase XerC